MKATRKACDWCGDSFETPYIIDVCSQACFENRKRARGKHVSYADGEPPPRIPPKDPSRWPGFPRKLSPAERRRRKALAERNRRDDRVRRRAS